MKQQKKRISLSFEYYTYKINTKQVSTKSQEAVENLLGNKIHSAVQQNSFRSATEFIPLHGKIYSAARQNLLRRTADFYLQHRKKNNLIPKAFVS